MGNYLNPGNSGFQEVVRSEVRQWYDGYDFPVFGSIYNPYSVMCAMQEKKCRSYWKKTSAAESLMTYINMDFDGLQETISRLISGEAVEVDTESFENDFETFRSHDDVLTLLIHLGYLTWNEEDGTAYIPNEEVRAEFRKILKGGNAGRKWMEQGSAMSRTTGERPPAGGRKGAIMEYLELGKAVRELAPDMEAGNPRNSEGTFLETEEDGILFVYSRFRGSNPADHAFADLCLMRSVDGGETFDEGEIILTCDKEGGVNMMCPSLLRMQNGEIGLFYLVRMTYDITKIFLRRSADGGRTWGERVCCTPLEDFFVINNDRVLRMASGRIILPVASHRSRGGILDGRSEMLCFLSDDDGKSWRVSAGKCTLPQASHCISGLQEPGVVQLRNGVLWGWARTELGRQYETFSMDEGDTWTVCQPSRFTSPNSPLCMKRGEDGRLYAVWNPIPEYNGREKPEYFTGGRTPLVIASSGDDGKTFTEPVAFEWDPESGYCYCAICFTRDALLLAYCAGGSRERSCLVKTRIRRLDKAELGRI